MNTSADNPTGLAKYERLIEYIIRNIQNGIYPDSTPLPGETTLAKDLRVSRATVREALEILSQRGIIAKQRGRRSIVNAAAVRGRPRQLRFGWISRDPFTRIMPVYLEIYNALQKSILSVNGNLLFLPLVNPQEEVWGCDILGELDGVFLAGVRRSTLINPLVDKLLSLPNVIEIDDIGDTPASYTICTDNYQAGKLAADYLVDNKRQTAVFVSNRSAFYRGFHDRSCGIIDALTSRGIAPILVTCDDDHIGTDKFAPVLITLLQEYPEIDTVWHATDEAAIRIRQQLQQLVPKPDGYYRSAGVDGLPTVLAGEKYHLSLRHPTGEIARLTFQTMLGFFAGQRPANSIRLVSPLLIPWTAEKAKFTQKNGVAS